MFGACNIPYASRIRVLLYALSFLTNDSLSLIIDIMTKGYQILIWIFKMPRCEKNILKKVIVKEVRFRPMKPKVYGIEKFLFSV